MNEEQLTVYAQPITSLYYIKTKLPEDILEKINEDIDFILKDKTNLEKWNENLAGNIE